jgi:hypothetical protein
MNIIHVTTKEQLDELYKGSALTFEGVSIEDEDLKAIFDWIKQYTPIKNETAYIISGKTMVDNYGLTGSNAYRPDIHIVSIKLSDMEDWSKIMIPRINVRGRWFDDIVDNNAMRERRKNG